MEIEVFKNLPKYFLMKPLSNNTEKRDILLRHTVNADNVPAWFVLLVIHGFISSPYAGTAAMGLSRSLQTSLSLLRDIFQCGSSLCALLGQGAESAYALQYLLARLVFLIN